MQYIMLVISDILLAGNFAISKVYQKKEGVSPAKGFKFNALVGISTAVIFFIINGFKCEFTLFSFILATIMNILVMVYTVISFNILKNGSMAQYTMFLMTGGMAVPYVWGLLFLDEDFSILRTIALLIIIVGIGFSNFTKSKTKTDTKQLLLCLSVFFINGFVSVVSKLHQVEETFETVSATEFIIIGNTSKFIIAGILFLLSRQKTEKQESAGRFGFVIAIGVISAIVSGSSYFIQLIAASDLPATVLYPFITGGSIVLSSLAGWLIFKDKLSKQLVIGIICCFIGTVLFL